MANHPEAGWKTEAVSQTLSMKLKLCLLVLAGWTACWASAAEFSKAESGTIARAVGGLLEHLHYRQAELDDNMSEMFLHNYLDALDYSHLIFLQADLDEFERRFGKRLDDLTLKADANPADEIFNRYLERLNERQQSIEKLLKEQFDFSQDESVLLSRNKAPWPKDEAEAEQLWRARIKYELLQGRLAKDKPEETLKTISKRYQRMVKYTKEFDSEEILQIYLTALAHAYDPHSDYMPPTEAANFEIQNVKLSLSGIGALLRSEDGYTRILRLVPGGPADLGEQLKPKDRIIAVAQGDGEAVDVVEMPLKKVVELIRGKRGTKVKLTVIPASSTDGSERKVITLIRDEVPLREQYAKARIIDHTEADGRTRRLGLIALPQFYDNCARDVEKLIGRLKTENVNGLILDLRRNGGGLLNEAIDLTGLFISKGPVVQVKDPRRTQVLEDQDPKVAYDGPLIVLVSHFSASASEILAAALQDYQRALIVGDQTTHGKGTVQSVLRLDSFIPEKKVANPGKLKLTVSKFYRIAGGTTQKYGVTPDITLPSVFDYMELGEAHLPNCLPAGGTQPVQYRALNRVKSCLEELQKKSTDRVSHSQDFRYVNEDIELYKKQLADKTISINEAKRLQEKADQKARTEARKKEREQRKTAKEKIFELTLETVDQNKPLAPLASMKTKDNAELAAAAEPGDPDLADAENDPPVDPQLDETVSILDDYSRLLGGANQDFVSGQANDPNSLADKANDRKASTTAEHP